MSLKSIFPIVIMVSLILATIMPMSEAQITSNKPPKLAFDNIRCLNCSYVLDVAGGLEFETHEITRNTIIESDLADIDILLLCCPLTPYFTQAEIDLILNFLQRGEALYIIPMFGYHYIDSYYNILYKEFNFTVSGEWSLLLYPEIKNVTFSHPIMDEVTHINARGYGSEHLVVNLDLLTNPAESILTSEGKPLFLVATYGEGKIFVDLTNGGIGYQNLHENRRIVRNALIWLKDKTQESFQVAIDGNFFNVTTLSNSIVSSFKCDKEEKSVIFNAMGLLGTVGSCNITIPKGLMWCDFVEQWQVAVDNRSTSYSVSENDNYTSLYFTYSHSSHTINVTSQYIIPEFPSFLILPLFMTATLLAVILYKRKHSTRV